MRNLILAVLLVGLSTIALAAENPAQKPAEKTTKDLVVDTFSEFYENLYNISKKESTKEEEQLREKIRLRIPFIFEKDKGQYSGQHSLSLVYSYEYDKSKHAEDYSLLPLGLLKWGESDESPLYECSYFYSLPLLTMYGNIKLKDDKDFSIFGSLPLLTIYAGNKTGSIFGSLPLLTMCETTKEKDGSEKSEGCILTPLIYNYITEENKKEKTHYVKRNFINLLNKDVLSLESDTESSRGSFVGPLVNWQKSKQTSGFEFNPLFAWHSKENESHLTISPLMTRFVTTSKGTEMRFDATKLWPLFYKAENKQEYDFLWPLSSFKITENGTLDMELGGGLLYSQTAEKSSIGAGLVYSATSSKDSEETEIGPFGLIYSHTRYKGKIKDAKSHLEKTEEDGRGVRLPDHRGRGLEDAI